MSHGADESWMSPLEKTIFYARRTNAAVIKVRRKKNIDVVVCLCDILRNQKTPRPACWELLAEVWALPSKFGHSDTHHSLTRSTHLLSPFKNRKINSVSPLRMCRHNFIIRRGNWILCWNEISCRPSGNWNSEKFIWSERERNEWIIKYYYDFDGWWLGGFVGKQFSIQHNGINRNVAINHL